MAFLNNSLTMTYPSASGCRSWLMPLTIQLNRRAYSPLARASRQSRALSTVRSLRICSPKTKLSILHATIRERNEQPLGKRIMAVLSSLDCRLPMNLFTKFKTVLVTTWKSKEILLLWPGWLSACACRTVCSLCICSPANIITLWL